MDIKQIAKSIYLDFDEEEWANLEEFFEEINKEIICLNEIDTNGVEAMDLPFVLNENELRMDTVGEIMSVEELLSNAPDQSEDMVRIVKVVS